MTFKAKLVTTCLIALIFFIYGTVKYMGRPYKADMLKVTEHNQKFYMVASNRYADSAQYYQCKGDDLNRDFYLNKAVEYYHLADSTAHNADKEAAILK